MTRYIIRLHEGVDIAAFAEKHTAERKFYSRAIPTVYLP